MGPRYAVTVSAEHRVPVARRSLVKVSVHVVNAHGERAPGPRSEYGMSTFIAAAPDADAVKRHAAAMFNRLTAQADYATWQRNMIARFPSLATATEPCLDFVQVTNAARTFDDASPTSAHE